MQPEQYPFLFNGAYIDKYDQLKEGYLVKDNYGNFVEKKLSFFYKANVFLRKGKLEEIAYRYVRFFKEYETSEIKVVFGLTFESDFNRVLNIASDIPRESECYKVKIAKEYISFENQVGAEFYLRFENNGHKMQMLAKDGLTKKDVILYFDYYIFPNRFFG